MLYMQCYTCNAIHAMLYMQCYTCNAIHAMLYMQCYSCNAIHTMLYMQCRTLEYNACMYTFSEQHWPYTLAGFERLGLLPVDQMRLWKNAQNVGQPLFVKINTSLLPWKKEARIFGYFGNLKKLPKVNNEPWSDLMQVDHYCTKQCKLPVQAICYSETQ
jgi:hypothetical protein